jgi:hypothetical protein
MEFEINTIQYNDDFGEGFIGNYVFAIHHVMDVLLALII